MASHRSLALRPLAGFRDQVNDRLSRKGKPYIAGHEPTDQVIEKLLADRLSSDAVQFLAYALSPRELVWWTCLCTWHAHGQQLDAISQAAFGAVVHWVQQPTPERANALPDPRKLETSVQRLLRLAKMVAEGTDLAGAAALAAGAVSIVSNRGREAKGFAVPYVKMGLRIARGELPWIVEGVAPVQFKEFADWAYESRREVPDAAEAPAAPSAPAELPRREKRFSFRSSPDS